MSTNNTNDAMPGLNMGYGTENAAYDGQRTRVEEAPLEEAFRVADSEAAPKRGSNQVRVCEASELAPGEKRIVEAQRGGVRVSVGVYNIGGRFHAIKNVCPHAGAPLCEGHIQTTHRPSDVGEFNPALEGRVLRCPWHGWEFDIVTGKALYDRTSRVATYACEVDDEGVLWLLL